MEQKKESIGIEESEEKVDPDREGDNTTVLETEAATNVDRTEALGHLDETKRYDEDASKSAPEKVDRDSNIWSDGCGPTQETSESKYTHDEKPQSEKELSESKSGDEEDENINLKTETEKLEEVNPRTEFGLEDEMAELEEGLKSQKSVPYVTGESPFWQTQEMGEDEVDPGVIDQTQISEVNQETESQHLTEATEDVAETEAESLHEKKRLLNNASPTLPTSSPEFRLPHKEMESPKPRDKLMVQPKDKPKHQRKYKNEPETDPGPCPCFPRKQKNRPGTNKEKRDNKDLIKPVQIRTRKV
ncbi:unnamed protein product [Protopolystoma xenopodis]|uniref:Uncharacterized protein n=1 Tax=Protopolystoma xenopodis TaxID=117903 RepID=A0A3S4ZEM0_9PLAT|nr:unnamed protein product [Protopolystoma xenopodis]